MDEALERAARWQVEHEARRRPIKAGGRLGDDRGQAADRALSERGARGCGPIGRVL